MEKRIKIVEEFQIPGTDTILEEGDTIEVLRESDIWNFIANSAPNDLAKGLHKALGKSASYAAEELSSFLKKTDIALAGMIDLDNREEMRDYENLSTAINQSIIEIEKL